MKTHQYSLSKEKALQKIKSYCTYQERNHNEVKQKLYSLGLYKSDAEQLISQLIEENYLNEERFAVQFAGGKFRMKKWGRIKIKQQLKLKQVSDYNIRQALKMIDENEYLKVLMNLAEKKWKSLKHEQHINRQSKVLNYLLQKGYEPQLVQTALSNLRKDITASNN